ncbi:hypothetical protein ILUMI_16833, partial [Ignelater luminosus]
MPIGVVKTERSIVGVACLIHKDWTLRDEKIMVVNLNIGSELLCLVIANGPNENERAEIQDEFYEALQRELDKVKGKFILLGDLNGR